MHRSMTCFVTFSRHRKNGFQKNPAEDGRCNSAASVLTTLSEILHFTSLCDKEVSLGVLSCCVILAYSLLKPRSLRTAQG